MTSQKFLCSIAGHSSLNQPINIWNFPVSQKNELPYIIVLGGVHGNEYEGIDLANNLVRNLILDDIFREKLLQKYSISIIPCLNPDGFILDTRQTLNDVDLNRNLPTKNWTKEYTNPKYKPGSKPLSEPENLVLANIIEKKLPHLIISCHSFTESLLLFNEIQNNWGLPEQFKKMAEKLNIPLVNKMNYQITGSLSQWGKEKNIPVLTIEAPRGEKWNAVKENFDQALTDFFEGKFA